MASYLNSATGWMKNQGAAAAGASVPLMQGGARAVGSGAGKVAGWFWTPAGASTAVAAGTPAAIVGGVNVLGFTATGITAGSYGAGMMSAAAIANGGGVAAGGTVATFQTIGASGLLAGIGALPAVAVAAGVGLTAYGGFKLIEYNRKK